MGARHAQPAAGVGRGRESEGLVLPWKPGNAGGGKEPWFWVLVREWRVREIGMRLTTPPAIRTLQRKLYVKAKTEPTKTPWARDAALYRGTGLRARRPVSPGRSASCGPVACLGVKPVREPCAGKRQARFDERSQETGYGRWD